METLESSLEPRVCPSLLLKAGSDVFFSLLSDCTGVIIAEVFCVITPGPASGRWALCGQGLNHHRGRLCVNILLPIATRGKYSNLLILDFLKTCQITSCSHFSLFVRVIPWCNLRFAEETKNDCVRWLSVYCDIIAFVCLVVRFFKKNQKTFHPLTTVQYRLKPQFHFSGTLSSINCSFSPSEK